jgi:hypothetical protein
MSERGDVGHEARAAQDLRAERKTEVEEAHGSGIPQRAAARPRSPPRSPRPT